MKVYAPPREVFTYMEAFEVIFNEIESSSGEKALNGNYNT